MSRAPGTLSESHSQSESTALSIVIVNSDGAEDTLRCIDSIYAHRPRESFEVILVDNCSAIPIQPQLFDRFPQVRIFSAPRRQGFARNYNLGVRQARGAYVMILNNDTRVHADALDHLLKALENNSTYGIVGPRLISLNGRVQSFCARALYTPLSYALILMFLDLGMPLGKGWELFLSRRIDKRKSGPLPCISGACMVVSRALLDRTGLLDESYDFYFEDVEWCHRAQRAGFQVAYVAEAVVTHIGDQSLARVKVWAKQSEFRSALRYFREYHGLSVRQAQLLWLVTATSFLMRMVAFAVIGLVRHNGYASAYLDLFRWILTQKPGVKAAENA